MYDLSKDWDHQKKLYLNTMQYKRDKNYDSQLRITYCTFCGNIREQKNTLKKHSLDVLSPETNSDP